MNPLDNKMLVAAKWLFELVESYETRLIELGDPPELVNSDIHKAAKLATVATIAAFEFTKNENPFSQN